MERNVKLVITYDGTEFHGWQFQPGLRTVQGEIQAAAARIVRRPVALVGASRTDSGVHARGQVAHLPTDRRLPVENLRRSIEHGLPADIAIVHAAEVPAEFHATRDAHSKLYRYTIYNTTRRPVEEFAARYSWNVWHPLDLSRMRAAARLLVGRHDFAAFANKGSERESTVRTIHRVDIHRRFRNVLVDVVGDGFLYNQVRIIVGTLVEVGRGHWPPQRVSEALESGDRSLAGRTAPAQGLCLQWIRYEPTGSMTHGA